MRINENFTADRIKDLREENIRLKRLDELKLTEEEKDVINDICSDIFRWASGNNNLVQGVIGESSLGYFTITYLLPTKNIDRNKISEWFKIQGFKSTKFMLKEDKICISIV